MKLSAYISLIVLTLTPVILGAQSLNRSLIAITGSEVNNSGFYLNQSIGEAFNGTDFANFHFITQGFQQPSLINKGGTAPPEAMDAIDVYPNPVSSHVNDLLTVSFRIKELTHYYIDVYDVRGAKIMHYNLENMSSQDIKLDFSNSGQGIYFVHVYSSNRKMDRHFKIEKF
ncbi:MAG: T9SS type A sorting domain-containing protein [Bacteroidota bacterium]